MNLKNCIEITDLQFKTALRLKEMNNFGLRISFFEDIISSFNHLTSKKWSLPTTTKFYLETVRRNYKIVHHSNIWVSNNKKLSTILSVGINLEKVNRVVYSAQTIIKDLENYNNFCIFETNSEDEFYSYLRLI